jgi:hypothetical protein
MKGKRSISLVSLAVAGLLVAACGGAAAPAEPEPDRVATRVAEELAVAATLTAAAPPPTAEPTSAPAPTEVPPPDAPVDATQPPADTPTSPPAEPAAPPTDTPPPPADTPVPPTDTPVPPTDTPPPPTPTPILIAVLPVDGGGSEAANIRNNNPPKDGRNVTLPGYSQNEVSEPMVYRDRIVFQAEVFDANVGTNDGDGIDNVQFTIEDDRGQQVHFRQENNPGYCVFGGGEPDCSVLVFADTGYKWPDGETIFPVQYSVSIDINPQYSGPVNWMWSFAVELPHDAARINSISVQGDRYAVDFQTFGFTPQLPGQHVHFFFDTVPPDQAGVPGQGPWKLYGGSSPFTEYGVGERPQDATQMCILVANEDHSVQPNTGNCVNLP